MFKLVLLAQADQPGNKAEGGPHSQAAARLASGLAARNGAGFAALSVSGPLSQEGGCVLHLPAEDALAEGRARLETLLRKVMPPGLTADVMHAAGFMHVEVLKAARILGPDLLVLGALAESDRCLEELSGLRTGEAMLVAEAAPCPVLLASGAAAAASGPFVRILVCVDIVGDEAVHAAKLLGFAARLAAREGAELQVLHVLALPPGQPTPGHGEMTWRIAGAQDRLAYLCQGLPGADRFTLLVSEGAPGVEVLKHARERKADLLVLALRDAGLGSTSAHVLEGARCPVLLAGPSALPAQSSKTAAAAKG